MSYTFNCPSCGSAINYQNFQAGTTCACPACGKSCNIPDPPPPGGDSGAELVGANVGHNTNYATNAAGGGTHATPPPTGFDQPKTGFGSPGTHVATPPSTTLANRWARLGAALVDAATFLVLYVAFFMMAGLSFGPAFTDPGMMESEMASGAMSGAFLFLIFGILVLAGINIYLLTTAGQTIGKKIVGIKIVRYDNNQNGGFVKNVLLRGIVNGLISSIPFLGGIYALVDILFIFGDERRCIHDIIAGTKVVNA